jgi:hypothetical protein
MRSLLKVICAIAITSAIGCAWKKADTNIYLWSPTKSFQAVVSIDPMGGQKILRVRKMSQQVVMDFVAGDVTAYYWEKEKDILYCSTSAVYGKPEIIAFDAVNGKKKQILGPTRFYKGYPDGADYYKIEKIEENYIFYTHSADIDADSYLEDLRQVRKVSKPSFDGPTKKVFQK